MQAVCWNNSCEGGGGAPTWNLIRPCKERADMQQKQRNTGGTRTVSEGVSSTRTTVLAQLLFLYVVTNISCEGTDKKREWAGRRTLGVPARLRSLTSLLDNGREPSDTARYAQSGRTDMMHLTSWLWWRKICGLTSEGNILSQNHYTLYWSLLFIQE